jgi:hypothetical protein
MRCSSGPALDSGFSRVNLKPNMDVILIATEGRAGEAEIAVEGQRLFVEDGLSTAARAAEPGPVADARFEVILVEPGSWQQAVSGNPDREKKLEHQWGWRYLGYGEIVAIDPVRIDLGMLLLELDLPVDTPDRVGEYAVIAIDRIRLLCAAT